MANDIPKIKRMMLKVSDGPDELVTIVSETGRKVVVRNAYGFTDTVKKSDLYDADPDVAEFSGTQSGL